MQCNLEDIEVRLWKQQNYKPILNEKYTFYDNAGIKYKNDFRKKFV